MQRFRNFRLDKANGKMLGVCAGLAKTTGIDVTFIRVGLVIVTLLGAFPWTLVAYGVAALVGRPRDFDSYSHKPLRSRSLSTRDWQAGMTDTDRRLAEVETYMASSNSRLAREIEQLR